MKMLKRLTAVAAAVLMSAMTFTACGDTAADDTAADTSAAAGDETAEGGNTAAPDKVYNIGICQLLEHAALDEATRGFKEALTEKLGEGNVKFDEQNAQGEATNCATICQGFTAGDYDLILANATGALQAAAAATDSIPIIGTSITDYATALSADEWNGTSGVNITGTSDLAPIDEQEDMLVEMFPDVKNVGILYCSAEPNSKYQAEMFAKALTEDGISYKEFTAADSNEIQSAVTSAIAECDVLYVPTDNTMANNAEIIKNVVVPANIPVIAGEEGICKGCGVATLSISYYDIGYKAGEMAYSILVNGTDPGSMPIEFAPNVTKMYNAEICETMGITPPEGYDAIAAEE